MYEKVKTDRCSCYYEPLNIASARSCYIPIPVNHLWFAVCTPNHTTSEHKHRGTCPSAISSSRYNMAALLLFCSTTVCIGYTGFSKLHQLILT